MLEGSRCPYKCGRGPSFSYPSKIPFLYRQLNRSQNKLNTIKIVHFCFFISTSTILRDSYRHNILSFHPKDPKRYTNFTHGNENKGRGHPYTRYARASLKKSKVKNKNKK